MECESLFIDITGRAVVDSTNSKAILQVSDMLATLAHDILPVA